MGATEAVRIESGARRRAARRLVVAGLILLALVVGPTLVPLLVPATSWSPRDLVLPSDRLPASGTPLFGPLDVGESLAIGVLWPMDRPVTVERIEPVVTGAGVASVGIVACRNARERGFSLGSDRGTDLADHCDAVVPAEGVTVGEVDGEVTSLVAVVQALVPGDVTFEGIRVTHRRGPFHRTELTGNGIVLDVR